MTASAGSPSGAPDSRLGGAAMAAEVATKLRAEIVEGVLAPNERITQGAVAERLEVSRLPVREALQQLAGEGLVSLERDVGARVTPLDPKDLIETYIVREALEPVLTESAARRIDAEQLAALRAINDESEVCAEREDIDGYLAVDRRLHGGIFAVADLPRVQAVITGTFATAERYRRAFSILPHRLETSVVEHRMILDAIERGAAEDAGELHRIHIRRTRLTLSEHPELFSRGGDDG
ncbi:MAG: GntR family transcriptional regulator [Actinobacteria bacterium]|nr:GntR family transcriptional regulator [Actinomycetota bacterium]